MKKFFKMIAGIGILAAIAGGIYYIYKNYFADKDWEDDMDEDDFDGFDDADEDESSDSRGYVTINIDDEPSASEDETSSEIKSTPEI